MSSVHENCKLRTCYVHKLFFAFVLTFRTIYVHMFWLCSELAIFMYWTREQSVVILWVSWCKNKSFWQLFTVILHIFHLAFSQFFFEIHQFTTISSWKCLKNYCLPCKRHECRFCKASLTGDWILLPLPWPILKMG